MHFEAPWHAQGLRWIASLLESAAALLERSAHEVRDECTGPNCVEKVRLRAHLRGL
ncbi:MAG: hypothetical protein WA190_10250 [Usitatibacter sp.]